jgi:hypothetical protein
VVGECFENVPQAEQPERSNQRRDSPNPEETLDSLTAGVMSGLYMRVEEKAGRSADHTIPNVAAANGRCTRRVMTELPLISIGVRKFPHSLHAVCFPRSCYLEFRSWKPSPDDPRVGRALPQL